MAILAAGSLVLVAGVQASVDAVRLARALGADCVLGLPSFDEDDLYANLAWLQERQEAMKELRDAVALARTCEVRSSAHWQVMQLTCKT